jgi:hypothetical protein
VAEVADAHLSGRAAYGWELWGLMVLVAWHEQRVASVPALPDGADVREMAVPAAAAR